MTEILSPHDIAENLRLAGLLSQGEARRLEQRISACAESKKAEGRRDGIVEAVRRANLVVAGIKATSQRAAAEKVLRAIERLLPQGSAALKEAYAHGYKDGTTEERRKSRAKQPKENHRLHSALRQPLGQPLQVAGEGAELAERPDGL